MKHLAHFKQALPCLWLASALKSRRKDVRHLKRAEPGLANRYEDFDQIVNEYQEHPRKRRIKALGGLLVDYYEGPPVGLGEHLRTRRKDHKLDECPYCGNPFSPDTLDHFLPKDGWPEFAILSNNLVPQCRDCAPKKGARYYSDEKSLAMFLHPMYSNALSRLRFVVNVDLKDGKPEFRPSFSIDSTLAADDIARLRIHLTELDVPSRIVRYCHRQYSRWKRKVEEKGFLVQDSLSIRVSELADSKHATNWEAAFLQGVLRNPDAIDDLQKCAPREPKTSEVSFVPLAD